MAQNQLVGYSAALASAAMVGLFTVINKWLLLEAVPALTAGAFTYLAAGLTLLPWALRSRGLKFPRPLLTVGWLVAGSLVGPSLYFLGLNLTSGVQGVLMINMEAVFTALLAFLLFQEKFTLSSAMASIVIVLGGSWLSWPTSGTALLAGNSLGNLLITLGYLGWATENNLGRLLSEDVPAITLVCLKALVAGVMLAILAILFGQGLFVPVHAVPGIVASGSISLGLSLALFYVAMQSVGAGRAGLISSTSVFWGVLAALLFLHEPLTPHILVGGTLMLVGLTIFAWESMRTSRAMAA